MQAIIKDKEICCNKEREKMKAVKARVTRGIQTGTLVKIADNSGAKVIQIISVKHWRGRRSRLSKGGVGSIVIGTVKEGNPDVRHTMVPCVIIRQRKEYMRTNGIRVKFEDNAAIVLKDESKGEPKGTIIKGPVAREVVERFPLVTRISTMVI
jgi:large subunit ribosomal protein L14